MPKSFPTTENGSWPGGRLQSQGKALGDRSRTPSEPSQGTSWAMPALPAPRGRQKIARGAGPWIRVSLAEEPCKGGTRSVVSPLQGSNLQPARDPGAHAPGYVLPLLRSWPLVLRQFVEKPSKEQRERANSREQAPPCSLRRIGEHKVGPLLKGRQEGKTI